MSKLDDYLEYEVAYLDLVRDIEGTCDKCEEALKVINTDIEYFNNQEMYLERRIANIKERIDNLKRDRLLIRRCFDDEKKELKKNFNHEYDNQFISISVRDFKNEFSLVTGILPEKINVKFDFDFLNPIFSYEKFDNVNDIVNSFIEDSNMHIRRYSLDRLFKIVMDFDCEESGFTLFMTSSLLDVQDDGKTFLEHCSPYVFDGTESRWGSKLVVDKNIDDIIISITFDDLVNDFYYHGVDDEVGNIIKKIFMNYIKKQDRDNVKTKSI